jgi:hypothetical protein
MIHHVPKDEDEVPPTNPGEEEYHKAIDVLEDFKEKLQQAKGLTKEQQEAFWDREMSKSAAKWPTNLMNKCPGTRLKGLELLGLLTNLGWGELQEMCGCEHYERVLDEFDLSDCTELVTGGEAIPVQDIPETINACIGRKLEEVIKEKLIEDGWDEQKVADSFLYNADPSPLAFYWSSDDEKLSEAAKKIAGEGCDE